MKRIFTIIAVFAAAVVSFAQPKITPQAKARAAELVSKMTLEEKCTLIHGTRNPGRDSTSDGFHILPIRRLGIPAVRMADGPQGVRNKTNST